MLILKKLQLNNFLSHEYTTVSFSPNEKALLSGDSGCGKSGIVESIIFALYGKGRTDNRSLVRRGATKTSVTLTLSEGENEYEIERSISEAGKHSVVVKINGKVHTIAGIREIQTWIETELVGMSYLLFINSIAYVQNSPDTFVSQSASGRKDLLLEILKAGDFETNYEKSKDAITYFNAKKTEAEYEASTCQRDIQQAKDIISKKDYYTERLTFTRNNIANLTEENDRLTKLVMSYASTDSEISLQTTIGEGLRRERMNLEASITNAETAIIELANLENKETLLISINQKLKDLYERKTKEDEELRIEQQANKEWEIKKAQEPGISDERIHDYHLSHIKEFKDEWDKIEQTPDCPSKDDCPYMQRKNENKERINQKITKELELETKELHERAVWRNEFNMMRHYDVLSQISLCVSIDDDIRKFEAQKKPLEISLASKGTLEEAVSGLSKLKQQRDEKLQQIAIVAHTIEELKKKLDPEEKRKVQIEESTTRIGLKEARDIEASSLGALEQIERMEKNIIIDMANMAGFKEEADNYTKKIELMTLLKEVFGNKGLKTVVLDFVLPNLEEEINQFLSKLSDFRVRLDTQKMKADGEGTTEGLFIQIINEQGEEMEFSSYSGGEKMRITIAISEALASLGKKIGFRIADEPIHSLDAENTENFAVVFKQILDTFPQFITVSHLPEIKSLFETVYTAKKKGGITTLNKENYGGE